MRGDYYTGLVNIVMKDKSKIYIEWLNLNKRDTNNIKT